eukprot:GEMP01004413.1.p1 GENE.GEMP01004413.1~~GEMP01004413.1.p1  ORF type:complete len:606 (+),score=219.19 GEMP01004413.1:188-2005(+)
MGDAKVAYERVLNRVSELEVDLGRTAAALQRSTEDNASLRSLHDDLQYAHERMRDKYDAMKVDLRAERDQRMLLEREFQDQIHEWHSALEAKAKDLEELQGMQPVREIEMIRLKLVEEIAEPYEDKLKVLASKVQVEHRKAADAKRVLEMEKLEREQEVCEHQRIMGELKADMKLQHDVLSKQLQGLEEDNRRLLEANATLQVLRAQNHEYHTKCKFFQSEISDMVTAHTAEVSELARTIASGQEETQKLKREKRQIEVEKERLRRELNDAQRQHVTDGEHAHAIASEIAALKADLNEARNAHAQLHITAPAAAARDAELLVELRSQVAALEKDVAVKTREVHLLHDRLASATATAAAAATSTQTKDKGDKSVASTMTTTRLREEADRLRIALAERESALTQVKSEYEAELEQRKLDHAKASVELKVLQDKLKEADQSVQQANERAGERERDIRSLEAERDQLRAELSKMEQKVRDTEEAHSVTTAKLVAAKHELALCAVRAEQLVLQREEAQRALEVTQHKSEDERKQHGEQVKELGGKVQSVKKMNRELKAKLRLVVEKLQDVQNEKASVLQVCDENRHKYELYMAEARNSLSIVDIPVVASR